MARIIAIANQKGGVGKTTTTHNIGAALAKKGKRVLLVDIDPQDGNLTASVGLNEDDYEVTIAHYLNAILVNDEVEDWTEGIINCKERFGIVPCDESLSQLELSGVFNDKNTILKDFINKIESNYDYILIDCPPTLGLITINAFVSADSVLIPTKAEYLPAKGTQSLLSIISMVKRSLNPGLSIDGILITQVDSRWAFPAQMIQLFREQYGRHIRIFDEVVPLTPRFIESSAMGVSNLKHNPTGEGTSVYMKVAEEVM